MNSEQLLFVIEGLCRVCKDLAETINHVASDPAFDQEHANAALEGAAGRFKEITGDELFERR